MEGLITWQSEVHMTYKQTWREMFYICMIIFAFIAILPALIILPALYRRTSSPGQWEYLTSLVYFVILLTRNTWR